MATRGDLQKKKKKKKKMYRKTRYGSLQNFVLHVSCKPLKAYVSIATKAACTNVVCKQGLWAQVSMGTGVGGHKYRWAQVSVGTSVGGHKCRWAQVSLGTRVGRHKCRKGTYVGGNKCRIAVIMEGHIYCRK